MEAHLNFYVCSELPWETQDEETLSFKEYVMDHLKNKETLIENLMRILAFGDIGFIESLDNHIQKVVKGSVLLNLHEGKNHIESLDKHILSIANSETGIFLQYLMFLN